MDSVFLKKSNGVVLDPRYRNRNPANSRASVWLGLISGTLLVVLFICLITKGPQVNRLKLTCVDMHDSEVLCIHFWSFVTLLPGSNLQCTPSLRVSSTFQAVKCLPTTAGSLLTNGRHQRPCSQPSIWIGASARTFNVLIGAGCEENPGLFSFRGKTTFQSSLFAWSTKHTAKINRKTLSNESETQLLVVCFPRHKHRRNPRRSQRPQTLETQIFYIDPRCEVRKQQRNVSVFKFKFSSFLDSHRPGPDDRIGRKETTSGHSSSLRWLPLRGGSGEAQHFLRYLSMKLGDLRLRRLLVDSPGSSSSSSGLHGKWRAIVIANTVIGGLGFILGLIALFCCVWRKGVSMRCWWNFTFGFGDRYHERDVREVPDYESSAGMNRPGPPLITPAGLYDLRMALPDFRAASRQDSGESRSRRSQIGSGPLLYAAEAFAFEALADATDGFAEENRIGAGSFGIVYRGVLADGRVVAIKRADRSNARKIEENESAFEAELEVLSRLHHKHLVNLVGFCDDHDERLLVYEYMSNGTLHDHLHRHRSIALSSWQARIKVALQAARGIEYLHTYAGRQIIHRDIKSANILLDSKWNARVSDFGLSLITPSEEHSHLTTGAAGTLGYMDPEYYRLQHLTTKSDVYSFGVVLMELLTGKKAIHRRITLAAGLSVVSPTNVNVVDYAVPPIRADELLSILDERVRVPEESENAAVEIMAEVAEQCVRLEGKDRPTMAEIVGRLETAHALSSACDTSILHEYEGSASSHIGPSRQMDSSKAPLDRAKGASLDLKQSSSTPESQECDSGTKLVPDGTQESTSPEEPDTET
ncbi:hypothetical protein Mapa_011949 [Marchantia paleacea]|nr:hypothetical protein Mapa_011949 [Marchantia paleacea]